MNIEDVHYLNMFLGIGAILLQIVSLVVILILIFNKGENKILSFIKRNFLILGLVLSLIPTLFSLFYSDILNYAACHLCWLQRIFMFPQVFLFGVALWRKDRGVIKYAFPLLLVGILISIYHNFFYYFGETTNLPCDASGVSCYQHLVSEFGGYISIPMLALTGFLGILTVILVTYFYKKEA